MSALAEYARIVEARLNELIPACARGVFATGRVPAPLAEAMRYSLFAGGKRLRPAMLMAACEMLGGDSSEALDYACAVEMIHTYSLIHDDLPGMDDDDMRRGRPTNHVVFGVGQAILAGDGLLNMAYEIMLARAACGENPRARLLAMREIAIGAGVTGMIAGQCADLYAEGRGDACEAMLDFIHRGKTMMMFVGAVRAGARLANADDANLEALTKYAEAFGLLFQASDDVLDITADAKLLGKSIGKDERDGKLTAVSVLTLDGARARVNELLERALDALADFGGEAGFLRALACDVARRDH